MKCHHCQQELTKAHSSNWDLSCPSSHAHVKLDSKGLIAYFRFYLYPTPEKRITIEKSSYNDKVYMSRHLKIWDRKKKNGQVSGKARRERKTILKIDMTFPCPMNPDGTIGAQRLYEKLKLYNLFS